ncbi:MAG: hypothetical protein RLY78_803 [Pseudomonadota bacterium]
MNLFTGEASEAWFGGEVPASVKPLLLQAATAAGDERSALLWTAQTLAPRSLGVYYALYKHHATRREFELAERAARRGLDEAALQAGLAGDWRTVQPGGGTDFHADGPARFWLFTLKALAFIHLRSGRPDAAAEFLDRIDILEPEARLGNDVIGRLLEAVRPAGGAPLSPRPPAA